MTGEIRIKRSLDKNGNWKLTNVYVIDGREVTKKEFDKALPSPKAERGTGHLTKSCRGWPIKSEGAAVHPKQRQKAIEHAKKIGIPTYFDRVGRPVFTSANHQRSYLKAIGMYNKDDNGGGQSRTYRLPEAPIHPDL